VVANRTLCRERLSARSLASRYVPSQHLLLSVASMGASRPRWVSLDFSSIKPVSISFSAASEPSVSLGSAHFHVLRWGSDDRFADHVLQNIVMFMPDGSAVDMLLSCPATVAAAARLEMSHTAPPSNSSPEALEAVSVFVALLRSSGMSLESSAPAPFASPPSKRERKEANRHGFRQISVAFQAPRVIRRQLWRAFKRYRLHFAGDKDTLRGSVARGVVHHIVLRDGVDVEKIFSRPRPLSEQQQAFVNKSVDAMLQDGILEPSYSPCSSVPVIVEKFDSAGEVKGYRMAIDYRLLNDLSLTDRYPLPGVEYILHQLARYPIHSSFDCRSHFWLIPLSDASRPLTATHFGLDRFLQFTVGSFGLKSMPATAQRFMDCIFSRSNEFPYLDDLNPGSTSWDGLVADVESVLERVYWANIILAADKVKVGFPVISTLGFDVGFNSISPHALKVDAILAMPKPSTPRELGLMIRMAQHFRKHIPFFSRLARPLNKALLGPVGPSGKRHMAKTLTWTPELDAAFSALRDSLKHALVLSPFDPSFGDLILETDYSALGFGYFLLQRAPDGDVRIIAAGSRACSVAESRYGPMTGETRCLLLAVREHEALLRGRTFIWRSDCRPALFLVTGQGRHSLMLLRARIELQRFDIIPEWRAGNLLAADPLSRCGFRKPESSDEQERAELLGIPLIGVVAVDPTATLFAA